MCKTPFFLNLLLVVSGSTFQLSDRMSASIGLRQKNIDSLADCLMSVSDPESASFGQHWSPGKVAQVFAPSAKTNDAMQAFEIVYIPVTIRPGFISMMPLRMRWSNFWVLNITFMSMNLVKHMSLGPGHTAPGSHKMQEQAAPVLPPDCAQAFTLACIWSLYNMMYVPKATDKNSFGVVSQTPATYLQSDLDIFFANFLPSLMAISIVNAVQGTDVGEDGWILQYTMSLVQPQSVTMLQVGDMLTGNFLSFNEWLDAVDGSYCTSEGGDDLAFDTQFPNPTVTGGVQEHSCRTVKPPYVILNSRADFEYHLSSFYAEQQCNEFAKLGLMGVTTVENGFINPTCLGLVKVAKDVWVAQENCWHNLTILYAGKGDRGGGFQVVSGWDATSGVGMPNLGVLIEKWLELPWVSKGNICGMLVVCTKKTATRKRLVLSVDISFAWSLVFGQQEVKVIIQGLSIASCETRLGRPT
ncbi:hypothetical protein B0H10DRAFT_1943375 [Mycena sp. CBHHK59/15]|nr:hypothetical protein B0H10DRAFT_1943375 [Mycena sp. CBHHK59/15]